MGAPGVVVEHRGSNHEGGANNRPASGGWVNARRTRARRRPEPVSLPANIRATDWRHPTSVRAPRPVARGGNAARRRARNRPGHRARLRLWRRLELQSRLPDGIRHEPSRLPGTHAVAAGTCGYHRYLLFMKTLSDCRVLIVDDAKANLDILVEGLKADHKLSVAMNGATALEVAARTPPDLVLL